LLIGTLVIAAVVGIIICGVYVTRVSTPRQLLSTVNGTSIRASDYVKALRLSSSSTSPEIVLNTLENNEVIRQGAVTLGISITDEETTEQIKVSLFPDPEEVSEEEFQESYQQLLDSLHLSDESFRSFIEADMLRLRVNEYMVGKTPEAALQVHVQGILVATEEEAQDVVARLGSGEDFADVAQEVSIDPASKESGGDLGWFPEGIKVTEFDAVAFNLELGTLSEPFSTQQGYWVIEVLEKEDNRPLAEAARQQLGSQSFSDWFQNQRAQKVDRKVDVNELEEVHEWAVEKIG
jgi:foldase protein PrsA